MATEYAFDRQNVSLGIEERSQVRNCNFSSLINASSLADGLNLELTFNDEIVGTHFVRRGIGVTGSLERKDGSPSFLKLDSTRRSAFY